MPDSYKAVSHWLLFPLLYCCLYFAPWRLQLNCSSVHSPQSSVVWSSHHHGWSSLTWSNVIDIVAGCGAICCCCRCVSGRGVTVCQIWAPEISTQLPRPLPRPRPKTRAKIEWTSDKPLARYNYFCPWTGEQGLLVAATRLSISDDPAGSPDLN